MFEDSTRILQQKRHVLNLKTLTSISQHQIKSTAEAYNNKLLKTGSKIDNGLYTTRRFILKKRQLNVLNFLLIIDVVLLYIYVPKPVFQYELDYTKSKSSLMYGIFSYLANFFICFQLAFIEKYQYQQLTQIQKQNYNYLWSIAVILFNFVCHPMPFLQGQNINYTYQGQSYSDCKMDYPLNYLLILVAFLRNIIYIIRGILINSYYYQPRTIRICSYYSLSSNKFLFAAKSLFKDMPIKLIIFVEIISILYFSFGIRMLERPIPIYPQRFQFYQNSIWFIFITVTTVGFGDLVVRSTFGYIILLCCLVIGSLNISATVGILINTLELDPQETETLFQMKRIKMTIDQKQLSALYIRNCLWRLWKNYKFRRNLTERINEKRIRRKLKISRKSYKGELSCGDFTEQLNRNFDNMLINIEYLLQNNHNILGFIGDSMFLDIYQKKQDNEDKSQSENMSRVLKKVNNILSNKKSAMFNQDITLKVKTNHKDSVDYIDSDVQQYSLFRMQKKGI